MPPPSRLPRPCEIGPRSHELLLETFLRTASGRTALHIAVERRDVVWLNYLASNGANPNIADKNGVTPLMSASRIGFFEGVEALVKAGAQVDTPSDTGETPLISAVLRGDTQMMRILLRAGANPAYLIGPPVYSAWK